MNNIEQGSTSNIRPLLIIISGPSGVGKDAILVHLKASGFSFHQVITATTRPKRTGERDGIDYHFLSEKQFHEMQQMGQFLEWAKVYDNYYGVLKKEIKEALEAKQDAIIKVDIQGATTIKQILSDAVFIFLMPPSIEELAERIKQRHGKPPADLELRLGKAQEEMKNTHLFDYVVESHKGKLDLAVSQINAIITAEKCRAKPRIVKL